MALVQPKKPTAGAFGVFANEKRPEFTKACQGQPVSAVSKMAGQEWKKLSEKLREPYQKKYELEKAQYDKDMAAFLESGGVKSKGLLLQRRERREAKEFRGSKARDPDAPKMPVGNAYGCWLAENREEVKKSLPADHNPITDVAKKAGEMWKVLPQSEKEKYDAMYKTAREQYLKKMEAYTEKEKALLEKEKAERAEKEKALLEKQKAERGLLALRFGQPLDEVPEAKTPKKREVAEEKVAKSATKRACTSTTKKSKASPEPVGVELGDEVLSKARTVGYESQLKNLALRPDVVASGKLANELLNALEASNGLVNPAKRALLGA